MTIEQLRQVHSTAPFVPYRLELADGNSVKVPHPESLLINPRNPRTVIAALPDGGFKIIDLLLVAAIEVTPRKVRSRNGR